MCEVSYPLLEGLSLNWLLLGLAFESHFCSKEGADKVMDTASGSPMALTPVPTKELPEREKERIQNSMVLILRNSRARALLRLF